MRMPEGYLIEKYNNMGASYTCSRLHDEAGARGMGLRTIGVRDTALTSAGPVNLGAVLPEADFAILRYKWGTTAPAIAARAAHTCNEADAFFRFVSKAEQRRRLSSPHFLVPDWQLVTGVPDFARTAGVLGAPFVVKAPDRSMGENVFLISSEEDLVPLGAFGPEKEWICERFAAESRGRDMRVFCLRGEPIAAMIRSAKDDFRANVALGAVTTPLDIEDWMRKGARDIYARTGLAVMGIDFLFGAEKPYLCEINVMPGLAGIEKTTGVNAAGAVMDMILADCGEGPQTTARQE